MYSSLTSPCVLTHVTTMTMASAAMADISPMKETKQLFQRKAKMATASDVRLGSLYEFGVI